MKADNCSYEDYKGKYPPALNEIAKDLQETDLNLILESALLLGYLIEHKVVEIKNDENGEFANLAITKLSQELYGLYWCLRGGSMYGAAHIVRSLMEIYAMTNYAIGKPSKRQRRISKFVQYRLVAMYGHYNHLKKRLESGAITQGEFNAMNVVNPKDLASVDDEKVKGWRKLFQVEGDDWHKVHWHSPTKIESLIEQTDFKESFKILYASTCHLTHMSPLSKGMFGGSLLMQKKDLPRVQEFVTSALISLCYTLKLLDEWKMPGLLGYFQPILTQAKWAQGEYARKPDNEK